MTDKKMQTPAEVVVEVLGGPRALSRDLETVGCKVDPATISRWSKSPGGIIASRYHLPLMELAKKKRQAMKLTANDLVFGREVQVVPSDAE